MLKKIRRSVLLILFIFMMAYALILFFKAQETVSDSGAIEVVFCPGDNCTEKTREFLETAEHSISCAFYDYGEVLDDVFEELISDKNVDVEFLVESDNYEDLPEIMKKNAQKDISRYYMHNKFCVVDSEKLWTGSANPTKRGFTTNNNHLLFIDSEKIAENYLSEFEELKDGGSKRTFPSKINLSGTIIENYFCPEDWCVSELLDELREAEKEVVFMTFSFTHPKVSEKLVELNRTGIKIKGIFEKSQNSRWSQKESLEKAGIDVIFDGNSANMHHKVFVIDNETVIAGSMNPTKNGDLRNDENILIIHDPMVAMLFRQEFDQLFNRKNND